MDVTATIAFLKGLKRWRARAGFLLNRFAQRIGLPAKIQKRFSDEMHGRYVGSNGTYELRKDTLDAWIVHPLHERETNAELDKLLQRKGGVMVDVGGYCGSVALRYRDRFDAVIIFEPFPFNADAIARNITLSRAGDSVTLVRAAASKERGTQMLYLDQEDTHSLVATDRAKAMPVDVVTLDEHLDEQGIGAHHVRFIKIDVEGAEIDVLKGATAILDRAHPLVLAEANTQEAESQLTAYFVARGYGLHRKTDGRNLIFRHPAQAVLS